MSMDAVKKKKRRLNLLNSPTSLKIAKSNREISENVIDLCSDDENSEFSPEKKPKNNNSNTSPGQSISTILYSPTTPKKEPRPGSTPNSNKFRSPRSNKFFSPTKNRRITSPQKAKRSLNNSLFSYNEPMILDRSFSEICEGFDDKTIFLLKIVHKYLQDHSLRRLLPETTDNLLSKCVNVVKPGMRLVCRLYWRRKGWYRKNEIKKIASDNTNNIDDPSLELMTRSLEQIGLVESSVFSDNNNKMTFDDFFELLKLEELKEICKELKLKVQTKIDAIRSLKNFSSRTLNISSYFMGPKSNNADRVLKMLELKTGSCYRLTEAAHTTFTKLYHLMYLGIDYGLIRENRLELLLINDKAKKETYPIDKDMRLDNASVIFNTRDEFERYINAYTIFENWEAAKTLNEKLEITSKVYYLYKKISEEEMKHPTLPLTSSSYKSLPTWLRKYTSAYKYIRILESSIQELKKSKTEIHDKLALDILSMLISQSAFRQHKKAEWYTEKALILHKRMNSYNEAAEILIEGFKSDMSEESKDAMRPRALIIATQKTTCNEIARHLRDELLLYVTKDSISEKDFKAKHIYKHPMENFYNRGKIKFETLTSKGERVVAEAEEFCITEYINSGQYTNGGHWEGRIITTIFFLLFWDIIYMRLPGIRGIFLTYYQMFPLDLFTESFYVNRKTLIDERLATIQNSENNNLLKKMQETWDTRPESELSGINRIIGWDNVSAVCSCLSPIAIAAICRRLALDYRYTHSGFPDLTLWNMHTKQIKFVEVKTDSDKPSIKQRQWLHYLRGCGVDVEFCYVGVNTTRCRARAGDNDD
ncbi:unnamed protein product [Parnassius apollo]|uniref:Fanconi-associated nuclease n=1 Tax=Parnassius apollo TaxID=110799 RepID=A0A8S3Y675_PARAO|nr:unnamed protein product [Parnassius apollo]